MTTLQIIKKLQALCKQGELRTWTIGQTTEAGYPCRGETFYTGWIHRGKYWAKRFSTNTLNGTLVEMLKYVEERNHEQYNAD